MTESPNNPPEPKKPKTWRRLLNKLKSSPKKFAGGVAAIAALGSLGYWGTRVLVKQKLPPFLETQIGKIIERPIDLGEVKGFSFNSIEFGNTVIPPTTTDTDRITVEGVQVGFNIFPVLFRRTLPLNATLINPDIYLEQEQDGEWINLDFLQSDPNQEQKDPLIYFDIAVDIEQADITAVPYQKNSLTAQVDGTGRFNQKKAFLAYDLDATVDKAKATIKGETKLKTGSTDTKLLVKDLSLADAATLLPNAPVNLDSGILNADLDINIPSFAEITAANIKGMVNLQNVAGEVTNLNAPVSAESKLNFSGRNADVKQTQATLGKVTAQVEGQVNLDTGYDLDVNILPFQLADLPNDLTEQIPVDLAGEVAAEVKLRGEIKDPQLTGKFNNTKTVTVAQTALEEINAEFRADLTQVVLENVQLTPVAGGNIIAEGTVATNLRQAFESKQGIDATKMPLAFSFQADLPTEELVSPYYQLPEQIAIGAIQARGEVEGTVAQPEGLVKWNIADARTTNVEEITGSGELVIAKQNLSLSNTKINYGDGTVDVTADTNLDSKQWQTSLDANDLNLRPFAKEFSNSNLNLDHPLGVDTATASFNGRLDQLEVSQIQGTADLNLDVNGGNVVVNSQLNHGNLQAEVATSRIQLDPFVTSLPVAASLQAGTITASGKVEQLLKLKDNPNLSSLKADADLDLLVDGETVAVNSQIDSGQIQADANTSQINLNRVVPNLPLPTKIKSSQVTATGELQQLLTFAENPNLNTFDAQVDADLDVAQGTVKAIANLQNNQWQADVNANNISSQVLLNKFAPSNLASVPVDNINAQANLAGELKPLLNNEINIPVAVNQVALNSGTQTVNAQGNLTLSNITSNLDLASTNLDIAANLDFDRLPIAEVAAASTQDNQLIAESINVAGKAEFDGQLNGKQILSAPTEDVSLTGDIRLLNFAFNNIAFDPVMTGTVNLQPQQQIALNLRGQQDVISASAVPCNASDCKLPYLPTNLELRQGEDTSQPIIVTGDRSGDLLNLDINNFPLALLNLAPGKVIGIDGALDGTTTGDIALNLDTLATQGNIKVDQPALSYIQADQFDADFNYDPTNNIAEVTNSSLDLGNSEYNLNAALNLDSGQIEGKLDIPEAYIQDVLMALRWFTVEDIVSLFNIPDYGSTASVKPAPQKETVDQSIARKLDQLRNVNRQIQANAAAKEAGNIPTELDVKGRYSGSVSLGGTIQTPQADFRVEGNNWQWQPQPTYPNIVRPLGLVIEESQFISLPKLLILGKLQGTTIDLTKASVQVQEALLSLRGKLSPEQLDTTFAVANLTVDNIANFVEIPVDITGEINSLGTIKGTPQKPQLEGKVAFSNGAFNGNILPAKLAGNYSYDGSELEFNTTAPDAIQVKANVPYPIIPGKSDRLTASAKIDEAAFVFLDALSQNYLNWIGGGGDAELEATARLDLERPGIIYDLDAQGVVNLEQAEVVVETPFFSEPFIGTGKITLDNQIVNVETLEATFADKNLSVVGKLPILSAVGNLDQPLTVDLPSAGEINIDQLYQGEVAGKIEVSGASLAPIIGGKVTIGKGQVSIPKAQAPSQEDAVQLVKTEVNKATSGTKANKSGKANAQLEQSAAESSFVTTLNDFKVNLQDVRLQQTLLYDFEVEGDLTLNGTVDDPRNIIPQGTILLTKANVDLFSSSFNIARNRENTIIFTPEAGIFNPKLDLVLRTQVEDINEQDFRDFRLAETNSNELDDPISESSSSQTVRINLVIDGETTEILPNLAQTNGSSCNVRFANESLVEAQDSYSKSELNRFTQCFNDSAYTGAEDRNLINSSAVELTSTPNLNQGEIINLLSGQFIALAQDLSNRSQSELFDLGVNRFILTPLQNRAFSVVDDTTVSLGKKIGLDYLSVFPNLEGVVEVDQKSSVQSTFNYVLGEVRVEYRRNF
ncbi:MAG: translocation/assembly module TamB domain-containing protein [Cyanobacteria bacterium P01_G01_bin.67]